MNKKNKVVRAVENQRKMINPSIKSTTEHIAATEWMRWEQEEPE